MIFFFILFFFDLNINLKKYYIKDYKDVKSIYCENEIEKTNFIELVKEIINKNGFKKLRSISMNSKISNEKSEDRKTVTSRMNAFTKINLYLVYVEN